MPYFYHFNKIGITIVDDNQWEPDEEFFVKLTLIPGKSENVKLGKTCIMEITILDDDEPGCLQFEKRGYLLKESCGNAEIGVLRQNGAAGIIGVKWRTIDKSAINGKDSRHFPTRDFIYHWRQLAILIFACSFF